MPRAPRVDVGWEIYHVINRANGRQTIFNTADEYRHFHNLLKEACNREGMRVLAYVVMPNHWHFVLHPREDGDLSLFMQWLTLTHTQQYRVKTETIGYGHIYQGRYKSFLVSDDHYLLTVIKYVEQNPLRARMVKRVEEWQWGSAYERLQDLPKERQILSKPPINLPRPYISWINTPTNEEKLIEVRTAVNKSKPFGTMKWSERMIERFGLELTTRTPG